MLGNVKTLWANSWPINAIGRNPVHFDGMKSQVSPTLRDGSCLEALDLNTLVLWEVS